MNETLLIQSMSDLTIDGNGSTLEQTVSPSVAAPIVELWNDTSLTIENMSIDGNYGGSNGSDVNEGDYGFVLEADAGVNLTHLAVNNIQGDFLYLSPPYDLANITDALNTNISVTDSSFTNAGYHGLTVESVNGFTVNHDTFSDIGEDAMDFEYDIYSTPFNPDGTPFFVAQDNVTIENSLWTYFSGDWLASEQGQVPGVQQQHVTLTGNTIDNSGPLIQITGTDPSQTTAPSQNQYLTITNNTATQASKPTYGGSITTLWPGSAMEIQNVADVNVSGNNFPMFDGICTAGLEYFCDTPYFAALRVWGSYGLAITDNNFGGALGVLYPANPAAPLSYQAANNSGNNANVTECGNTYGIAGSQVDAACTATAN